VDPNFCESVWDPLDALADTQRVHVAEPIFSELQPMPEIYMMSRKLMERTGDELDVIPRFTDGLRKGALNLQVLLQPSVHRVRSQVGKQEVIKELRQCRLPLHTES
jgi:hypothetical protein